VDFDWRYAARGVTEWFVQNCPLAVAAVCLPGIWRRRDTYSQAQWAVLIFAISAFPLFCYAASVQVNTHMVTLTALACILAGVGVFGPTGTLSDAKRRKWIVMPLAIVWILAHVAEPGYHFAERFVRPRQAVGVAGLRGIRAYSDEAEWLRRLSKAMADAGPAEAPVFVASHRNDMVVYCSPLPYWLTKRRIITRHHQLHPAVTDTAAYQKRMIDDLESGPWPVIVREHRFEDEELDRELKSMSKGLSEFDLPDDRKIGSRLLDEWINRNYAAGLRFGISDQPFYYELMIRREADSQDDTSH